MTDPTAKLLAVASGSIGTPICGDRDRGSEVPPELFRLLSGRNGFYAFESALHVFAIGPSDKKDLDLLTWNRQDLWRQAYPGFIEPGDLFFAQDAFGGQFVLREGVVYSFDPETGGLEVIAKNLDEWARAILADFEYLTGYPMAHSWQELNGPIPIGRRLVPKVPFVLGGEFEPGNLAALDAVKGMLFRGDVATQIRDLPDGSSVELRMVE